MNDGFKKLMRKQIQESLDEFLMLAQKPVPAKGWIRTVRDALGISSSVLAKKLKCSRANVTQMEKRENKGTISLEILEQVANALGCKLVYCLVPIEPLDKILEKQAQRVAKKRINAINHSMKLEQQGLNHKQLQQQEDDLIKELLQDDPKKLWDNDEV